MRIHNQRNQSFLLQYSVVLILFLLPIALFSGDKNTSSVLDGKSFPGSIRAKGIIGLMKVKGTLSFKGETMIWSVEGSNDKSPYTVSRDGNVHRFSSHVEMENGETVDWTGSYDGKTIREVEAVWTRVKGDFIHDLFLPDQVTLVFTAK